MNLCVSSESLERHWLTSQLVAYRTKATFELVQYYTQL